MNEAELDVLADQSLTLPHPGEHEKRMARPLADMEAACWKKSPDGLPQSEADKAPRYSFTSNQTAFLSFGSPL